MPHRIICCSLYPALQRTLLFDTLTPGAVNRVNGVTETTGGKAVNSARTLRALGADPLLTGFCGGIVGARIRALLQAEGLQHTFTPSVMSSRICQTLLAGNQSHVTELVEPGGPPTIEEAELLRATVHAALATAHALIMAGTLPPQLPSSAYAALVPADFDRQALLDTAGEALISTLNRHALTVKINARELFASVPGKQPLESAAHHLLASGAKRVGVTQGADDAWLVTPERTYRFRIPAVPVISTLGCGDAVNAGFVTGLLRGDADNDAFAFGLACGCACAMQPVPGAVDPAAVADLYRRIR